MSGVNVRNLKKIQDKWLLFQRFVTSIVGEPNSLPREPGIVFYRRQNGKSILCGRIWDVIAAHSLRILK